MNVSLIPTTNLREHPENIRLFGDPMDCDEYAAITKSIKTNGIREPLHVKPDCTVLSGHLRLLVARELRLKSVPVVFVGDVDDYRDEIKYMVAANVERRHMTKAQIAYAFKKLRTTPKAKGGTQRKRGPRSAKEKRQFAAGNSGPGTIFNGREEAASLLGVSEAMGRRLETVFADDVPPELKSAVESGKVGARPAAEAVKRERKKQGGEIADPAPLIQLTQPKPRSRQKVALDLVADRAKAIEAHERRLLCIHRDLAEAQRDLPLKSISGATDFHRIAEQLRSIALLAWAEVEDATQPTTVGRQMRIADLTAIDGGAQ